MRTAAKATVTILSLAVLGAWLVAPTSAPAKTKKMKSCAAEETALASTGQGDTDGDGLSNCRESKQLHTSPTLADTDGDGLADGQELAEHSDPLDVDSDDDGAEDGHDSTPSIPLQKVKAFLDTLTCPQVGVPGSIGALGISVAINDQTEFDDTTCDALLALLQTPGRPVRVEIKLVEDTTGALTATEIEAHECDRQNKDED